MDRLLSLSCTEPRDLLGSGMLSRALAMTRVAGIISRISAFRYFIW
jgi:hypothetical protein